MSILKIVPLGPKIDSQEALSGKIAYIIRAEDGAFNRKSR